MKKNHSRHREADSYILITNFIRKMKLTLFVVLLSIIQTFANTGYSQNTRFTLAKENSSIEDVLGILEKSSDFYFLYNGKLVDVTQKVTINVENELLEGTLNKLFRNANITYKIYERQVVLSPADAVSTSQQQKKTIAGKVTDPTGSTLPGVSVILKGTTIGVITDNNGSYALSNIPENAILQFSFMGMKTQEVAVSGKTTINVALAEDAIGIEEVVAIGYGTVKKRNLTGASTTFKAENIDERPVTRVDQALVGQMAGVQVRQTTGVPGKAFSIQIRGAGSISASNEPLYVIDGFPLAQTSSTSGNFASGNPLDNINPNDIESIQVLKDAATGAIYGSRAANGVVLITTKQGTGKSQVNFNTFTGFSEPSRKIDMLSAEEWIDRAVEMHDAAWVASKSGRTANQTTEERRLILGLKPGEVNTLLMIDDRWIQPGHPGLRLFDWQDEIFRKGLMQNYQLSASGGNEYVKYYVSGNYAKQQGITLDTDYSSYSVRANVELNVSKKLKLGVNLTTTFSITNDPGIEGVNNVIQTGMLFTPVQEETTGLYANAFNNAAYKWGTSPSSPVAKLENTIGRTNRFRTLISTYAEYKILEGLTFKTTGNLDNTDNNTKNYMPYTITGSLTARQNQPGVGTTGSFLGYKRQTFVNENTLSFNKLINEIHDISVLAGTSYNYGKVDNVSLNSLNGFSNNVITTLNAASSITGNTIETKNVLLSYFGRIQYALNDKYLFSTSLRKDGSSRFGENTKWGWFPSVSLGWRVSEEKFMDKIESLSDLKFRISWGKSGNYNIGDYSSIPLLGFNNYSYNNIQAYGQFPNGVVNSELSWEKTQTLDVGVDVGVFNNRVTASFDYYNKLSTDLLLNVPIPANTGFPTVLNNAGKVRNKGWEFELNSRNLTGNFQWTTSLSLSYNTNKVIELAGGQTQILIPSSFDISHSILKVGEPMYSINVVKMIGILTQDDINKKVALFGTETVGDPKYYDANIDGTIDANDRVIVGHPSPDYIFGLTNTFKYKGFDLSALFQGQMGGSIYSLLGRAIRRTGQDYSGNVLGVSRNRWHSPDNPGDGVIPKAFATFGRIKNTDWLYSSDYWRVRNITLGYNLGKILNPKYVKGARIYITAENWFGKDKYYGGFNPEASNTDLSGSSSFPESGDYGGMPLAKSLIVGLNFTL